MPGVPYDLPVIMWPQVDHKYIARAGDQNQAVPLAVTSDMYIGGIPTDNQEVMQYIRTNKLVYTIQQSEGHFLNGPAYM